MAKRKIHGMCSVVTMNVSTYDKLQRCLGVNFEKETKRLKRINKKRRKSFK